jgi:hypothetical protein
MRPQKKLCSRIYFKLGKEKNHFFVSFSFFFFFLFLSLSLPCSLFAIEGSFLLIGTG